MLRWECYSTTWTTSVAGGSGALDVIPDTAEPKKNTKIGTTIAADKKVI